MAKNDKKTLNTTDEASLEVLELTAEAAEDTEGLVKMHKDGEHLHVHPTTVEAHKAAGWEVA